MIVATTEGINLYAGMLDYPVEDAQIADEAVLHAQVQRGRLHDAVQTARRAAPGLSLGGSEVEDSSHSNTGHWSTGALGTRGARLCSVNAQSQTTGARQTRFSSDHHGICKVT